MSSHVEKIKEKLSIVDVVGSYVTLEKAGTNFKAKCPFHNEKSASFFVSPARNSYYCFGCGAKGDILSFVQQFEGLDFMGALRVLAKRAGVELSRENPSIRTERERLYLVMEHATLFFQRNLAKNSAARTYLKTRGLEEKTVQEWRLGYASLEWKELFTYLRSKGLSGEDCEKVGLIKKSEKVKGDYYDRFRGRIMFPVFDSSGRVVAFSGRQLENDGTEAKYINSPETPLFEKSKILYGYDRAKLEIRRQDFSLLVEGQIDLVMSHQAGFSNAVASSGTALTETHLEMMKRLSSKLVIAYDGDRAGQTAAARGWQLALGLGMEVKIAKMPEGKDPADIIKESPDIFKKAIADAGHIIDSELERILAEEKDVRIRGKRIEQFILPYIATLQSEIERSYFISRVADKAELKENTVWQEVEKIQARFKNTPNPTYAPQKTKEVQEKERRHSIERAIMGIIYWQEKQETQLIDPKIVRRDLEAVIGKDGREQVEKDIDKAKDELIFEAEISYAKSTKLAEHVQELIENLRQEYVRDAFAEAMKNLHRAEREGNQDKILELLKKCQELSLQLRSLSKK